MNFKKFPSAASEGSDKFLKIKPGTSQVGVLRGEIYDYFVLWADGKTQIVSSTTPKAKPRFRVNVVVYDAESKKMIPKIFEFGLTVYNQFAEIAEHYDITRMKVSIARKGEKLDTEWTVMPLVGPKHDLSETAMKMIEAVDLLQLEPSNRPEGAMKPSEGDFPGFDAPIPEHLEIPF